MRLTLSDRVLGSEAKSWHWEQSLSEFRMMQIDASSLHSLSAIRPNLSQKLTLTADLYSKGPFLFNPP